MPARGRSRGRRGPTTEWWVAVDAIAPGALADDAQVAILDEIIDDPVSGDRLPDGLIASPSVWYHVNDAGAAACLGPVEWVLLLIRAGDTVPTVITDANKKAAERFVWALGYLGVMEGSALISGSIATQANYFGMINIQTSRRFERGDRVVLVIVNKTGRAFGAGSVSNVTCDAVVVPR